MEPRSEMSEWERNLRRSKLRSHFDVLTACEDELCETNETIVEVQNIKDALGEEFHDVMRHHEERRCELVAKKRKLEEELFLRRLDLMKPTPTKAKFKRRI